MTPHEIAIFLVPWVLGLATYALLILGSLKMFAITNRMAAVLVGHSRVTRRDTAWAALIGLLALGLMREINRLAPGPQWWSQPLHSGWEISSATMGVLVLAAAPILGLLAFWAMAACLLIITGWLGAPADADDPRSPTRWRQIGNVAAAIWEAYRPRRTHTTSSEGSA